MTDASEAPVVAPHEGGATPRPALRTLQAMIFLLVYATNLYFHHGGDWNQNTRLDLTRAIVEGHTFCIDKYAANTRDKCVHDGHTYCDKAPGLSFLAVPAFFVAHHSMRLLGVSLGSDTYSIVTVYVTRALTVCLIAALGAVLFFRLVYFLSGDLGASVITTVGYALGTIMLPYGMVFYAHVLGAVFCLAAFYLVFTLRHGHSTRSRRLTAVAVGLLLGFSVISEYPTAMLAGLIGLYAISTLRGHTITAAVAGALPLLLLFGYNSVCFGGPFATGYDGYAATSANLFAKMGTGFYGLTLPHPGVLYQITLGHYRGLFIFCPFLVLGLVGLGRMAVERRFRAEFALFVAGIVAFLLFNSSYAYWHGGSSIGPRHLTPIVPYLSAAAVFTVVRYRAVSCAVTLFSISLLLMIVMVTHGVGEEQQDPIPKLVGMFRHHRISWGGTPVFSRNDTISVHWNSFNLAALLGFRFRASVLPLAIFWLWMFGRLYAVVRRLRDPAADAPAKAASSAVGMGPQRAPVSMQAVLFLLVYCTNLYFNQGGDWNQNSRLNLTRAIVEQHTFCIDRYADNTRDRCRFGGHFYSDKAPGLSLLSVPAYFVVYHGGRLLGGSPDGDLFNILTVYLTRALTIYVIAAFGAVLLFRLAYFLSGNLIASVLTTVGYALGTLALPYGMLFYGHVASGVFCLTAFYVLFVFRHGYTTRSATRTAFWTGLFLGLSVITEYPTAILAAFIGLYAVATLRKHTAIAVAVGAFPIAALLLYNYACFNAPYYVGYLAFKQEYVGGGSRQFRQSLVWMTLPDLKAVCSLTFGSYRGLFTFCPFLILGLPGVFYMAKGSRFRWECLLFAASIVAFFVFNAATVGWQGGSCLGPRYLTPIIPYLSLAAVFTVLRFRAVSKFAVVVSAAMLLIMTSVASGVEMYNTDPLYALWHLYVVGDVPPTAKSLFMRNQSFVMGAISTGDNRVFARNNTINSSWNSFNMGEVFGGPKRLGVQETILPLIFFQFGMWRLLVLLARRREESGPGVPDGGRAS